MRAFIGLSAPEGWIAPLMRAGSHLSGGRAVDAEDLHVTFAFLDDQPAEQLEALHEELETTRLSGALLQPRTFAVLGGDAPRAVVLDLTATPALTALRDRVRQAARRAGVSLPRDRFRPHITLRRYSRTARADISRLQGTLARLTTDGLAPAQAGALTLWSSVLTPEGSIYDPLASYKVEAA